ncbi:MAG: NAD(P)-dependent methylenetetrahydromethanopterin dehydrogenase [Planctomycetota bacterium]
MQKILVCLDPDLQPSVFDAVVAVDAGADHLFRHGGVRPEDVEGLVHGAMFTRGPADLKNTAVFVGGSDVAAAEALAAAAVKCFFGPMRVSVLQDANGSNTTAAAAVLAAGRHVELAAGVTAAIIGTGPVGQRAALMLAGEGVHVRLCSRTRARADQARDALATKVDASLLSAIGTAETPIAQAIDGAQVLIAAGPAGVEVLQQPACEAAASLRAVVDLNAVPPLGVGGIDVMDKAVQRAKQVHYGAIGVGGDKMKIHKAAVRRLFETNDAVLDAAEVYAIGKALQA